MNLDKYTFSLSIQARWNDLDPLGHVNNAVYFSYFEVGRGQFMNVASKTWNWNNNMFLLGKISAVFLKEMTLNDQEPTIWVRTAKLGNKSFDLEYLITTNKGDERLIHCAGESTQVMFNLKDHQTMVIPNWLREELTEYEKSESILL